MKGIRRIVPLPWLAFAALALAAPGVPPEFTHRHADEWINSQPLTLGALKGKVVLVEFWAFACDNCLNSRAWVESLERSKALIGHDGLLYGSVPGEMHVGDERAQKVEAAIDQLLKAPAT